MRIGEGVLLFHAGIREDGGVCVGPKLPQELEAGEQVTSEKGGGEESRKASSSEMSLQWSITKAGGRGGRCLGATNQSGGVL